jgi:hypothetical protein
VEDQERDESIPLRWHWSVEPSEPTTIAFDKFLWEGGILRRCHYLDYRASNGNVIDESEGIWKEAVAVGA